MSDNKKLWLKSRRTSIAYEYSKKKQTGQSVLLLRLNSNGQSLWLRYTQGRRWLDKQQIRKAGQSSS